MKERAKKRFFSDEIVNKGRQSEFDWAKAFSIIVMITIHVYEELSVVDYNTTPEGVFRNVLEFLAGPLAAPLFMFSMGVGIMYSRNTTPGKMAIRGAKLMRNGYLLSFFKGTIFVIIGVALGMQTPMTVAESFFLVSILQFAGMAFFVIALMKKFDFSLPAMLTTAVLLSFLSTFLNTFNMQGGKQYFLGLFFMTNNVTSFPMFLWLYYPVAGMIFAYLLQRAIDKKRFYLYTFIIGVTGLVITSISYILCGVEIKTMYELKDRLFYTQTPRHLLFTSFVILIGMSVYYLLSVTITVKPIISAVTYMGSNLDIIYINQWLLVAYTETAMILAKADKLPVVWIIPVAIVILLLSIGISEVYVRFIKKKLIAFAEKISPGKQAE